MGTSSLGWCLRRDDEFVDMGARIFHDGRDPKKGTSLAVDRRIARGARRRRDRYLGRRKALMKTLVAYGLMPTDKKERKNLENLDPYDLRAKGLDEALPPHHFGRAIFHLNQRRGFKSNRKADRSNEDPEKGKIASGTEALNEAMEAEDARTFGEFLSRRNGDYLPKGEKRKKNAKGQAKRIRMRDGDEGYAYYPDRSHYEDEFKQLWKEQSRHHPDILTEEAHDDIHRIIFYQRPLKEQQIGKCTFAGINGVPEDALRLAKAHPLFQQRRLYEEVNQLRIVKAGAQDRSLSKEERDTLILKLRDKKNVTYKSLAKTIKLADGESFNKASERRKDMAGNEINAALADKNAFHTRWYHFDSDTQWEIIQKILDEEDFTALTTWLKSAHGVDEDQARYIANISLPEGHGRFGEMATRALLAELKDDVITYSEAAERAGFNHSDFRTGEIFKKLPYYGQILQRHVPPGKDEFGDAEERRYGKITNPTVHIALNQLRKLVNEIIDRYGKPDQIMVELARELKMNEKQKKDFNKSLKKNTDDAIARGEILQDLAKEHGDNRRYADTGANRMRLRLWQNLGDNILERACPYCGEKISKADLFANGVIDIDHIIPYSKSLDDSVANKTVCHAACNRSKANRTPWEAWNGTERWDKIADQVKRLKKNQQWRFAPDALERVEKDGGFQARQLTDTQYLSRMTAQYLSALYPEKGKGSRHVFALPGRMTGMLRRYWALNDLLPDHHFVENPHSNAPKNRLDHRHHIIDAAVICGTSVKLIKDMATLAAQAEEALSERPLMEVPLPWEGFRNELKQHLDDVVISFKPDHGRAKPRSAAAKEKLKPKDKSAANNDVTTGQLHNDTAYGITGRKDSRKNDLVRTRIALNAVKPKHLTDPEAMTDHDLQELLYSATQGTKGKDFEKALLDFANSKTLPNGEHNPYYKIRRVRVYEGLKVIPISRKSGKNGDKGEIYKGYKGNSNSRISIWRLPDDKWTANVVSTFDWNQPGFAEEKPHPAAKKLFQLTQNDMVKMEFEEGKPEIFRLVKFSAKGQMTFSPHHEAGPLKARDAAPNSEDPFKYVNKSASSLLSAKARKVHVDILGRVYDPGAYA